MRKQLIAKLTAPDGEVTTLTLGFEGASKTYYFADGSFTPKQLGTYVVRIEERVPDNVIPDGPRPDTWGCRHSAQSWYYSTVQNSYGCEDCDEKSGNVVNEWIK